jgi:hypothetical protein
VDVALFQQKSIKGLLVYPSMDLEVVGSHGCSTETKDIQFCSRMDGKEASSVSVVNNIIVLDD